MRISDLAGKNVCILGFGKEGHSVLNALQRQGIDCEVTVCDKNEVVEVPKAKHVGKQLGTGWLQNLETFDVIVKSPGIPPQPQIDAVKDKTTSATKLFFGSVEGTGAMIVGITGSKGKSTTTSLIHAILTAAGKHSVLVGNIGKPALDQLDDAKPGTIFTLEMSSYQLMDMGVSPHIAVVTAFFPEHLDYHGSLEAYKAAKANIARFQKPEDIVFYCGDSQGAKDIASVGKGKKVSFSWKDAPLKIEETHLLGQHNLGNIAGALAATAELGVPGDVALAAVKQFHGLPHRLQNVGEHGGIRWIDDAISTTPESAIAALDALGDDVITIILGGQDRGVDFTSLGKRIKQSKVLTVILFPGSGPRIREAIGDAHADVCFHEVDSMEKAVAQALKNTMPGKICLLSTASPSYGMFKNFEEKGDVFQAEIKRQTA